MGKSDYQRVKDVIDKLEIKEQIEGLVEPKHRPAAKYKKDPKDQFARPDLKVGKRVVFGVGQDRWSRNPIKGYALGIVLDWGTGNDGWYSSTRLIVQVVKVSNPALDHLVGHLRAVDIGAWGDQPTARMPFFVPEEGDPKDYKL